MKLMLAAVAAIALAAPAFGHPEHDHSDGYAAALADPGRPADEVARDAARKPAELLAFAGVKPGQTVLDFIMGGGYLTRILAKAVEPGGTVYALQPLQFVQFRAQYGTEQDVVAAAYKNVKPLRPSLGAVSVPEPVDVIITVQNYHDMHLKIAPPTLAGMVDKALFAALKPGGTLVVVDHVGSGPDAPEKLHRIDPATVRAEVEAAGFVYDGELKLWANPADRHTAIVFDPSIRGHTDQFAYRFRKPK